MADKAESGKTKEVSKPKASEGAVMHPLSSLQKEIDAVFDRFASFSPFGDWRSSFGERFAMPEAFAKAGIAAKSDVAESKKSYDITVELPGVAEKDITVSVDQGVVSIKGEKRAEEKKEEKEGGYYLQERSYGSFSRSFRIPDDVDSEKIGASYKDGVLSVSLPRTKEVKPKGRQIKIGSK